MLIFDNQIFMFILLITEMNFIDLKLHFVEVNSIFETD